MMMAIRNLIKFVCSSPKIDKNGVNLERSCEVTVKTGEYTYEEESAKIKRR